MPSASRNNFPLYGSSFSRPSSAPGPWKTCRCPRSRSVFRRSCRGKKWSRLIECADSPLHRVCILTLYATGVRREELVQLKLEHIDSARMLLHIRQGKGKKDRDVMLSPRLLQELRDYWRTAKRKPTNYLFPSQGSQPNDDVPMT